MNCKKINNAHKDKQYAAINNIKRSIIMGTHPERDNEKILPNTETACPFVETLKFIQY